MLKHMLCIFATLSISLPSIAAPITDIFVIGDSTADAGNLSNDPAFQLLLGQPGQPVLSDPPFFQGRLSDGPNFVDVLSQYLVGDLTNASVLGGNNYAYAGAVTSGNVLGSAPLAPNMLSQTNSLIAAQGSFDENDLVVISGGFNNFFVNQALGNPLTDLQVVTQILTDMSSIVTSLGSVGATRFLISSDTSVVNNFPVNLFPGLFDINLLDYSSLVGFAATNPQMFGFNPFGAPSCFIRDSQGNIFTFDPNTFNPFGDIEAQYNVPGTCLDIGFATSDFLLLDGTHVTKNVQTFIGNQAINLVPGPASIMFVLFGLTALGLRRKAKK